MKGTLISCLSIVASFIMALNALAQDGFQGTIFFRNGDCVQFDHIGDLKSIKKAEIWGKLGSQEVRYSLSEVREVIFADRNMYYDNSPSWRGNMIIVSRQGERFTIAQSSFYAGDLGWAYYVYQDPVTKVLRETRAQIKDNVSQIVIGEKVGDLKRNPKTGEYFPSLYLYDPFTGEKLEWATRK